MCCYSNFQFFQQPKFALEEFCFAKLCNLIKKQMNKQLTLICSFKSISVFWFLIILNYFKQFLWARSWYWVSTCISNIYIFQVSEIYSIHIFNALTGADLGLIWQWSPLLGTRKLAPKKTFSCEKQTCICHKKTLIYIKVSLKGLKEFHFKLFLALALASGATRPHLGVSKHPPNTQFQGLKKHLYSYRRPNYFSRKAPDWLLDMFSKLAAEIISKSHG